MTEENTKKESMVIPIFDVSEESDKEKKLGQILKKMYTSNINNTKMAEFHLFVLQYAKAINKYKLDFRKILEEAGLNKSFYTEFIKMNGVYKLCTTLGYVLHETKVDKNDSFVHDASSYNIFGIHIKNRNDALSESNPHVCIGWSRLGDPSLYQTKDELKEAYSKIYGGNKKSIGQGVGQILRFTKEMKEGDIILFADNTSLHIGRIVSNSLWVEDPGQNQDEDYKNNRKVKWIKKNINRKNLPNDLNDSLNTKMSFWHLDDYKEIINQLIDDTYIHYENYDKQEDEIPCSIDYLPIIEPKGEKIRDINRIVYGAPGTGKTYSTARIALEIIYEDNLQELDRLKTLNRSKLMKEYQDFVYSKQIAFVTFHQSYGYEEFVQGIRPIPNSNSISFENYDGIFKSMSQKALSDPSNNYVLIIDEINRGNISKIFGELITLIEPDKRWGEMNQLSITLPSGDIFVVPNNLYIVGTMNSADKSISLIDAALRRRFIFIEQYPDETLIENEVLRSVFAKLNGSLADKLNGTDLLIGHSYFMGKKEEDLCAIMNESVIPLLYEYFYDNKNKVVDTVKEVIEGLGYYIQDNNKGRIKVKKS